MTTPKGIADRALSLALCLMLLVGLAAACRPARGPELKVVATTSLLGSIVERLAGDRADLTVITAPAACPGEFDVTPGQVQATAEATLFLMHGWPGEAFTEGLLDSVDSPGLRVEVIELKGNWMTPDIQA
jgi:ABC-type Zn uptake system ZnuABC Zn-binding protein ZnuA